MDQRITSETHCPANKAADMIGDRWVLQIVRAMMMGARRYGELQQAIPRISPSILSARLKLLAEQGIIAKREISGSKSTTYRLTPSGRELRPIIEHLGIWGLNWAARHVKERDVDIGALMWDLHKSLRVRELPDGETVIHFALTDVERFPKWWIMADGRKVDLCSDDPGKDVDVYITCGLAELLRLWRGERSLRDALNDDSVQLDGPPYLLRSAGSWFPVSPLAARAGP